MNLIKTVEDSNVQEFIQGALHAPGGERLTIDVGSWNHETSLADPVKWERIVLEFVKMAGFHNERGQWRLVDADLAHRITAFVASKSLSSGAPVSEKVDGDATARKFMSLFPRPMRFITNGKFEREGEPTAPIARLAAWNPITEATLDSGIIVVSANRIGMLWAQDES